jgi:hypothetical protein
MDLTLMVLLRNHPNFVEWATATLEKFQAEAKRDLALEAEY